jgi:perosamine synthetase
VEFRHQLTAYSPITAAAMADAALAGRRGRGAADLLCGFLRERYEADRVLLLGSGTEALQVAIRLALQRVERGARLALPAFSCYDLAAAAVGADVPVQFYDVDPHSLQPDPDSLALAMEAGARVAVVSPLYGYPVDWAALEFCAAEHGAVLIEDAAQGHAALWRGRFLGALGSISVLSFGRGKGWTGSSGGAVLLRGNGPLPPDIFGTAPGRPAPDLKIVIAAMLQWGVGRPELYALPAALPWLGLGTTRYRPPTAPRTMAAAAAALLWSTRQVAEKEVEQRVRNAQFLLRTIASSGRVRPIGVVPDGRPGFLRLPVRHQGGFHGLADPRRASRLGMAPGYPMTLPSIPALRAYRLDVKARYPGAEQLARELVTLPTHSRVTAGDRAQILELLGCAPVDPPGHPRSR